MRNIHYIIISIILIGITSASLEIIKSNEDRIIDIRSATNVSSSSSVTYINYTYSNLTQLLDVSISTPFIDGQCVQTLGGVFVIGSCASGSGDITSVQGDIYITNGSNTGAVNLKFNETKINSTINNLIDNDEFHYNQTTPAIDHYKSNPSGYYNLTTLPASSGNASWNQSLANTLYASIIWGYNHTSIANSYTDSQVNKSFNQTLTDSLYSGIEWDYNQTTATFNLYGIWWYNQTIPAITDINNRFWNRTQSYNITEINSFNASWTSTYNVTYHGLINNASYLSTYNVTYDAKISFNNTNLMYLNNSQTITGINNFSVNQTITSAKFFDNGTCTFIQRGNNKWGICG